MKKCPFCNADIEDNARFCLYCMSSLEEKKTVENTLSKNKRWLYILAAFLLLVLIFSIIMIKLSKNDVNNASSEVLTQSEIIATDSSSDILTHNTDGTDKNDNKKNNNTANKNSTVQGGNEDENTGGSSDQTGGNKGGSTGGSSDQTGGNKGGSTGGSSEQTGSNEGGSTGGSSEQTGGNEGGSTGGSSEQTGSDDSDSEGGSSEQTGSDDTPTKTEAVYIYRDAVAKDCYTEGNIPAQPISDVIVITGVSVASSDGIYTIPETIDGKKVGGIMPYAFCDSSIAATVKKVVIPSTVKTIWQNAFSSCYNLTDIYLKGKTINIFETAFADTSKRTGTLTIHCAHDCKTFAFYYYRNIVSNYGAQYKVWNGGEIE